MNERRVVDNDARHALGFPAEGEHIRLAGLGIQLSALNHAHV